MNALPQSHILLVDDDPEVRDILGSFLTGLGAEVSAADGVQRAEELLSRDRSVDLIMSDVHLPGNSRLQWIERVVSRPDGPPLILMTGNPEIDSAVRAANLPVVGYLTKPLDYANLPALLERRLSEQCRRRDLQTLSQELTTLADAPNFQGSLLSEKIATVARLLPSAGRDASRATFDAASEGKLRTAVQDAIHVLEETKHSFRSKALGRLRVDLQNLLAESAAASGRK